MLISSGVVDLPLFLRPRKKEHRSSVLGIEHLQGALPVNFPKVIREINYR
jgi:hypothetical protein